MYLLGPLALKLPVLQQPAPASWLHSKLLLAYLLQLKQLRKLIYKKPAGVYMKRMKNILFLLLTIGTITLPAQDHIESQVVYYNIFYNHLFDRGKDFKQYDAILYMQGDRSLFTMKRNDKIEDAYQTNYFDASPDSLFTVFKDFESNSLLFDFYHLQQGNIIYADTLHPMEWKLESEERIVGGIPCKKATVRFKGRDYVAWYAPSIPISNGPWKLGGLPGLILEAYDERQEWHAVYNNMKDVAFIDFSYYEKLVNKGVSSFTDFINDLKILLKRISGSLSNKGSDDCLTCMKTSLVTMYMWEKID
jgi:GLPGLI family protein